MKNLKIVLFVAKFDPTRKNPWLTDELCEELDKQGHAIDVLYLDWYREYSPGSVLCYSNTRVHIIAPFGGGRGLLSKIGRWTFSSFLVYKYYISKFKFGSHDLLISFSPSVIFGFALLKLRRAFKYRILIQWDFFPYHQAQIGLIPYKFITVVGASIEAKLLSTFNFIGCMSPRNVSYLNNHYKIGSKVEVGIIPLWSKIRDKPVIDRGLVRKEFNLSESAFIAVFGGQIAPGRGVEDIVVAANIAAKNNLPIHFLFVGKGPKLAWLNELAININCGFTVLSHVAREKYLELISSCDIGIVATVRDVDVPTFPSKILDYCCVGLPVVASVERSTDFGEIISAAGFGYLCEANDGLRLLDVCLSIGNDKSSIEDLNRKSRKFYEDNFDVKNVVFDLIAKVDDFDQNQK